ncbi:Gfo/Idh/MocA family protein [Ramlibacter albus]|uniref:Gfo/Idh/MocA family oxidoreductase n=1 Tax=Ramlibacter albus TaxID=2079448 RepID=A0A923MC99_9BURK|nr:Gfo/Idh/MocA family oxidoreductase [Ramlibacter albus]MBC5766749.1 Gfo/Idh/MocA family oxidoreductase [Ramlibacter albus]
MAAGSTPGTAPPPIRLGMVGGGEGAFIGAVHRYAARLDGDYALVAGALAATPEKARRSGLALGLAEDRIYDDYAHMAVAEAARPDGIEAVAIVTPNHLHAPVATAFLQAGIHVICDKPVTATAAEAQALRDLVERSGLVFALTHNYTGYAMVRHARQMVQDGALGRIRVVQVEYPQDWLAEPIERSGNKQADWRADPARAGAGGCIGDIGTHALQLAEFVSGQQATAICAELTSFVDGRLLDDNAQVMLRYSDGARGTLWASQVAPGHANDLRLRIYGSSGGIEWRQQQPDELLWSPLGQPTQIIRRGTPAANAAAARVSRLPGGHPEGYIEAFGTLYREIADHLRAARARGQAKAPRDSHFPTVADGLRGLQFVEAAVASSRAGGCWVTMPA